MESIKSSNAPWYWYKYTETEGSIQKTNEIEISAGIAGKVQDSSVLSPKS